MKVIRTKTAIKRLTGQKGSIVTLGNFDGVHLGHRRIIERVVRRARSLGVPSVVYTFEPHPRKVVAPGKGPLLITDLAEKTRQVASLGVDFLVLARFTIDFAKKHPAEFTEEVISRHLCAREVFVGHDYAFGSGASGTVSALKEMGGILGFKVTVVPACKRGGEVVSSSLIRRLLSSGEVARAAKLLGRPYTVSGSVTRGRSIGRAMGFPTANLKPCTELVPGRGVYAAMARIGNSKKTHMSVVNIGTAPTFERKKSIIEAHMLDFKSSVYGKSMELGLVKRLRNERCFSSEASLKSQIARDAEDAKKILARLPATQEAGRLKKR